LATRGWPWESPIADYQRRVADAGASDVDRLVAEYHKSYDVASDVTVDDLAATARAELALRGMVRDHRLDAYSYQFLEFGDDERTETLPFVARADAEQASGSAKVI
jgi:L-arabinose isomerase